MDILISFIISLILSLFPFFNIHAFQILCNLLVLIVKLFSTESSPCKIRHIDILDSFFLFFLLESVQRIVSIIFLYPVSYQFLQIHFSTISDWITIGSFKIEFHDLSVSIFTETTKDFLVLTNDTKLSVLNVSSVFFFLCVRASLYLDILF